MEWFCKKLWQFFVTCPVKIIVSFDKDGKDVMNHYGEGYYSNKFMMNIACGKLLWQGMNSVSIYENCQSKGEYHAQRLSETHWEDMALQR